MRNFSIVCLVLLGGLPFSAGLARPAQAEGGDPCDGLKEWALFVEGEPADEFVARARIRGDEEEVRRFIRSPEPEGLGIDLDIPDLVDLLRRMDEAPQAALADVPEALRGISGLSTTLLLQKLLPLDDNPIADKVLYGKIRDYTFVKDTGRGHLGVDVCIDRKEFVPVGEDRREFFHWDIEVPEAGFSIKERDPPSDPSDPDTYDVPFPGLPDLVLPERSIDPANPKSIWRRGLDHKLHAKGAGIEVRHIHYRKLSDPDLVRLRDGPGGHHLYNSTEASCVDLFTEGPPPGTFGELADNDYCLGRCAHPPIVNSGD